MGDRKPWAMLAAVALLATACNDSTPPPTLATATTAPTTVASSVTTPPTTAPPTTTTSTTSTSTTQSPDARFAEIERMAQEAFVGRLRAYYFEDPASLLLYVGSQAMYDNDVEGISQGAIVFSSEPTNENSRLTLEEVLLDREDCVVGVVSVELTSVVGVPSVDPDIHVWWPSEDRQRLRDAALWDISTPEFQWIEECDIATRGIVP